MNERIEELWIQSWTTEAPGYDYEKFAELIVKECINEIAYIGKANEVFGDRTDRGGLNHILWTTETAIEKIKEHFGVDSTSIKVGSRVKVVSGFNVGAKGTVSYIEPTGRMWVMRDGASTDVFYHPEEVVRIEE